MKFENNWEQKSLENLEKSDSGVPAKENSRIVNRVLELRKIPLNQFTIEDIRFMIGQSEGLAYLVVLSIDILKANLFAEGDFFPGDLLKNILHIDTAFWKSNKQLYLEIEDLIRGKEDMLN